MNRRSRPAPFRPALRTLEDRTAPAVLTVTNLSDHDPGSLRAELALANDGDTIQFADGVRSTLGVTTELELHKSVTIVGPGADQLAVSAAAPTRVFEVFNGADVTLSGLTVSLGYARGNLGGGGALVGINAALTVNACTFGNNIATTGSASPALGGSIFNAGTLTVTASTFFDNYATGTGGAIFSQGILTITTSTFAGNSTGSLGSGGGAIDNSGIMAVTASTFTGNSAPTDGGGIKSDGGQTTLSNTIVAGNTGAGGVASDLSGFLQAGSTYNLIGTGGSGGLVDGIDHNRVGFASPGLGVLGNYGGPTQTVPLLAGSPALNAGDPALLGTPDQRGAVRAIGVNTGAFQASATTIDLGVPASVTAGVPFAVVATARDVYAQPAVGFVGPVDLDSTDPQAPGGLGSYTFGPADGGSHTFEGVVLFTAPEQLLYVSASGLPGEALVQVLPAAASVAYLVPSDYHATPGVPFTVTLYLYDAYGNAATNYTGTVTFGSSNAAAVLPADYTFTADDAGAHAFTVTLGTPFEETVTVGDTLSAFAAATTLAVY